jgi:lysophospholipid acyltransferase (LPLAT)-like uncharacterized protein
MAYAASRAWLIKWDKFVIPWPLSKVVIAIGEPKYVPRVTDAKAIEKLQTELTAELKKLYGIAQATLKGAA